jgi:hypothetical protein
MNLAPNSPHGTLVAATSADHSRLSRQAKSGQAMRLAAGLYALGATLPPEQVARHHLYAIVSHVWPGAVLCGRTALAGGVPIDSEVYIAHPDPPRRGELALPGVVAVPFVGPPALPGDMEFPNGLWLAGQARQLIENVALRGRQPRYRAGTDAVDDRIDELARSGGAGRIQETMNQLDVIAGSFDPVAVDIVRHRLAAVLGTFSHNGPPVGGRLGARLSGSPFDAHRVDMLSGLVDMLLDRPPAPCPAFLPVARWEWLAFFEAYFSNFIEGTEFGVEEARRIAVEGVVPQARPKDAHDVAATYRLAVDNGERVTVPRSGDELIALLKRRHSALMAARPDKHPGQIKKLPNFAGGYQFVEPALVEGTLQKGFDVLAPLREPLSRAAAMMALITECHPFDDGNGRIARLAANAELSAAGEVRLVIANVFRNNYLAALTGFSNGAGRGEQLVAVLEFAQRWSAAVDWTTFAGAHTIVDSCNAYLDAGAAEASGRRLTMPAHAIEVDRQPK